MSFRLYIALESARRPIGIKVTRKPVVRAFTSQPRMISILFSGKTDRIDIASFYPILAILEDVCHAHAAKDMHPALLHQVIGRPVVFGFPDNTAAKVVSLGQDIHPADCGSPKWWPNAPAEKARRRLLMRIMREGEVLPIVTAVCIALLSTMYTTTSSRATKESQRRVRLQYKSSPTSDFGIAKGAVDVKCQDQVAYFDGEKFWKGQDPNDQDLLPHCTRRRHHPRSFTLHIRLLHHGFVYSLHDWIDIRHFTRRRPIQLLSWLSLWQRSQQEHYWTSHRKTVRLCSQKPGSSSCHSPYERHAISFHRWRRGRHVGLHRRLCQCEYAAPGRLECHKFLRSQHVLGHRRYFEEEGLGELAEGRCDRD